MIPEYDITDAQGKAAMLDTVITGYCPSCKLRLPWAMELWPSEQLSFIVRPVQMDICPNCQTCMTYCRPGETPAPGCVTEFYWAWQQKKILKDYVLSLDVMHPPSYWERCTGILVVDPDGWDRAVGNKKAWEEEWAVPMTYAEFKFRCSASTCRYPRGTLI